MDLGKGISPFIDCKSNGGNSIEGPLLDNPEFLSLAIARAGVGTWQLDTATSLLSWNAVTSEILGLNPVPGSGADFGPGISIHPDDLAMVTDSVNACVLHGAAHDVEYRCVRKDGETRWVHAMATPVASSEAPPRYIAGIISDITDRRNSEDRLRTAEERYRLISRATMDMVYEWDVVADTLIWNDALSSCFGYIPQNLASIQSLRHLIHPDDVEHVTQAFRACFHSTVDQIAIEHRMLRADGTYAFVLSCGHIVRDESGRPCRMLGSVQDVTDRKLADAALRQSEAINRSIVEGSTECIMVIDLEGKLEFMNGPGLRALAIEDVEALYGKDWISLWPRKAAWMVVEALDRARAGGIGTFSAAGKTLLGVVNWWDVVISPVLGEDGKPAKLVVIARDVTDRRGAEQLLLWAATRDSLTGLTNRASFQDALTSAVADAKTDPTTRIGLMLLDLDDFKQVNDSMGHDAGDALLKTVAERLQQAAPDGAIVARLGGDEFAVLVEGISHEKELCELSADILQTLRAPLLHHGRILDCYATIGMAIYPRHGITPDDLLKSADIALYVAKADARGGSIMFKSEHRAAIQGRNSMIALAKTAVRDNLIVPFYQSKVELADRTVYGFEALLRWIHPKRGVQPPATIVAAFDDLEVAAAISDRIFDQVVADMRTWLDQGVDFGHVAVNAAAAEFRRDNFAESLLQRLHHAQIPTYCFQLEVTETVFLGRGSDYVDRALKLLSAAGVSIALDDFGTGYASLRHLKQFPVDVIKIDQSFVRDMDADPEDAAIIGAVLNLGRSLQIGVVAEGIETELQERHLLKLGCCFGQGFLYSAAVPARFVPEVVRASSRSSNAGIHQKQGGRAA